MAVLSTAFCTAQYKEAAIKPKTPWSAQSQVVYGYGYDWNVETTQLCRHSDGRDVLQIIDLVATDQLIIGKKILWIPIQQYYTEEWNDATGFIGWVMFSY
jgi:hypothetical protein